MSQNLPAPSSSTDPVDRIREALDEGDLTTVEAILKDLHPADQVKVLSQLGDEERDRCLDLYEAPEIGPLISESFGRLREHLLDHFPPDVLAEVVQELDSDEAADLLQDLEDHAADRVLAGLSFEDRAEVEPLLSYPEDTAGGRMQREVFVVPAKARTRKVLAELRKVGRDLEELQDIYLVDNRGVLAGVISIFQLLRLELHTPVVEGANMDPLFVTPEEDQELVASLFRKHRLHSLPVVDDTGRILGQITADDILGVMEEEATEDLYRLANINEASDLTEPIIRAFRRRASWLTTNAVAGILSATIVSFFSGSISALPALAALMPIVANLGGMGGVQTATIIVRAMALGHMEGASPVRVTTRQATVGLLIGLFFCLIGAAVAYSTLGSPGLALVFGVSLALILLLSGILGSVIPITLKRLGFDPALVSGGLLTTLTDSIGFLLFLGLASWLLF
ncbi:hypothetical protein AN478_11680 [Thiohalorhabdus denitrificans]|uniref:Magnesium transporter MgtE n=1 Tax=Thiohalorhabdus denitrificans TaxID=381306 RepID=A0A0P9C844_9GAMM|nr:magnesium transporter [Thiohalorhabdus denitrificans]KPV39378.1 hypothetical protein AN478_11680 [Thiohalorhabdus denitrificans]SCY66993.1 magnesium transporter [Thiohalorhabdus denitrificans]